MCTHNQTGRGERNRRRGERRMRKRKSESEKEKLLQHDHQVLGSSYTLHISNNHGANPYPNY